jgi:hypothetical protein
VSPDYFFVRLLICSLCVLSGCPELDTTGGTGVSNSSAAGSGSSSASNCLPLHGLYRASYAEVSGTCGPQSEELLEYNNGVQAMSGTSNCQAGGSVMVSPCELRRNSSCALSEGTTGSLLGQARVVGSLMETDSNRRLEGDLEITLTDTSGATCKSTYDVIVVRVR